MVYPIKIYARALVEVISTESDERKREKAVLNLVTLLKKRGDLKNASKIIDLVKKLLAKKSGGKKITFETARKLSENDRNALLKMVSEKDFVEERINPEIVAGIKIIINDEYQLDNSIFKKIKGIFK